MAVDERTATQRPVLVAVDDEESQLAVIRRLADSLYDVHTFFEPHDALSAVPALHPAVLLLDYYMPEMTGLELLHELRQRGIEAPALLLTGRADTAEVVAAKLSGLVLRVLAKPCPPEKMMEEVALAVGVGRAVHATAGLAERFSIIAFAVEVRKALGAHATWKALLREAIETGSSGFSVDRVAAENGCEFGKWLLVGDLPENAKSHPRFASVCRLHAEFHKVAANVLKLALDKKKNEALQQLSSNGVYTRLSTDLTKELVAWLSDVAPTSVPQPSSRNAHASGGKK